MDIHPDAVMPQSPSLAPSKPVRVDAGANSNAAATQLRARLLKMIVENEKSRQRSSIESKPR
jgi:hypothetical protein